MNKSVSVGQVYYIPSLHQLVEVRGFEDGFVQCSGLCDFLRDTRTVILSCRFTTDETSEFVLVEDPSQIPQLEEAWEGVWSVIRQKFVHPNLVQERLEQIAGFLRTQSEVNDVYVFGSVARSGMGNDFDIIATVSDSVFQSWRTRLLRSLYLDGFDANRFDFRRENLGRCIKPRNFDAYFNSTLRLDKAEEVLAVSAQDRLALWELQYFRKTIGSKGFPKDLLYMKVDLFLFPENWQERVDELQGTLPHKDPNFMQNLLREARMV